MTEITVLATVESGMHMVAQSDDIEEIPSIIKVLLRNADSRVEAMTIDIDFGWEDNSTCNASGKSS